MYVLMYIQYKIYSIYIYIIRYRFRYPLEKLAQLTAHSSVSGHRRQMESFWQPEIAPERRSIGPIWGFHKWRYPNSWMVYNGKSY